MQSICEYLLSDGTLQLHLKAVFLGMVRLFAFVSMSPALGPNVTNGIKMPLLAALYLPLHPLMLEEASLLKTDTFNDLLFVFAVIVKESIVGIFFAYLTSLIFYIALSAGSVIDNQRGASMAQTSDPLSGAETSPLGNALFLCMITLFFVSGSFMHFLELFYSSYSLLPVLKMLPSLTSSNLAVYALSNLDYMMEQAVLVCAPFLLVALLCDIALGLINRFAPQLNVFILSMPIKSGVCSLLIIFYLSHFMNYLYEIFSQLYERFTAMLRIFGG
ncbi:MAG: type III secretion system export apparatus subunit SctT [Succinivibrio sp.]